MSGIVVDGARPAVEWVTSLPAEWRVIESERLILLCLACDAYKLESAPGYEAVAEWTGMKRSSCAEILSRLCKPTERRPALVERISVRGRRRTIWRLLVDSEPSGHAGQFNRPAPQDGCDPEPSGTTGRLEDEQPPANRPATPDSSEPNRRRTVGEPSANRPATPDAPLAPTQTQEQVLRTCSAADAPEPDAPPLFEVVVQGRRKQSRRKAKDDAQPNPHYPRAKALCDEWWSELPTKPSSRNAFQSTLMIVLGDIEVGRTDDEIRYALRECGVAVTSSAMNFQYERLARNGKANGQSKNDAELRDLIGRIQAAEAERAAQVIGGRDGAA